MKNDVLEVQVKAVVPTANGFAVFLGAGGKHIVIHIDPFLGSLMQMALSGVKGKRPFTHDLIGHILLGLGAEIVHVLINDTKDGTFFARLLLRMENELGKKVIEIDARPSDSIVLAIQHSRPVLISRGVLDKVDDMTELYEHLVAQKEKSDAPNPAGKNDDDDDGDDDGDDDDADDDDDDDDDGTDDGDDDNDDDLPGFSDDDDDDDDNNDNDDADDDDIFADDDVLDDDDD